MGKKRATSRPKGVTKSGGSRRQIYKKKGQKVLQAFQQMSLNDNDSNENRCLSSLVAKQQPNDVEHSLLRVRGKAQTSAKKGSTFVQASTSERDNDNTSVNERNQRSLNISSNPSQPSREEVCRLTESFQTNDNFNKFDISFIQAIICLKSIAACVSQLSVGRLQEIFNRQWSTQDSYIKKEGGNEEQSAKKSKHSYIEKPSEAIDTQDILMLTPRHVSDMLCSPSPGGLIELPATSNETQIDLSSCVSTSDINKTPVFSSSQNKWTSYIAKSNRREESLPEFDAIPAMDEELAYNSELDVSESETFDSWTELQIHDIKLDETIEHLTQLTSRNCAERANEDAAKNMVDIKNVFAASSPASSMQYNDFADISFSWKPLFTQTTDQNEQHKLTSSTAKQSDQMNDLFQLKPCFGEDFISPIVITQPISRDASSPTFDYTPKNLAVTPPNDMSPINIDSKLDKLQHFNNFQTGSYLQSPTGVFNSNRSTFEAKFNDLDKPDTPINNVIVQSPMCDSAYSTEVHHYCVGETEKPAANKRVSYDNTGHHYNLRLLKRRETAATSIDSSSVMRGSNTSCIICDKQPFAKKCKRGCPRKWAPAKWLDFTLESLYMEYVVLESVRVILTIVSDEKTAEEYATRRCWKNNLMGEAVNAVLNMSDAFELEEKPDICRKSIVTTVTETLDKIVTGVQSNEAYTSQVYRVQMILELCNSASVSVAIIDHLMAKLKLFQSILNQETEIRRNIYGTINQLHLVFYALNIAVRKYRTIVPNAGKRRAAETIIPHVADLWKMRYIDKKLQHTQLSMNDAEQRWRTVLEDFTMVSTERFVQFAKKSLSLIDVLNSQQISSDTRHF